MSKRTISIEDIACDLGISRQAVNKRIARLIRYGTLSADILPGRGQKAFFDVKTAETIKSPFTRRMRDSMVVARLKKAFVALNDEYPLEVGRHSVSLNPQTGELEIILKLHDRFQSVILNQPDDLEDPLKCVASIKEMLSQSTPHAIS